MFAQGRQHAGEGLVAALAVQLQADDLFVQVQVLRGDLDSPLQDLLGPGVSPRSCSTIAKPSQGAALPVGPSIARR